MLRVNSARFSTFVLYSICSASCIPLISSLQACFGSACAQTLLLVRNTTLIPPEASSGGREEKEGRAHTARLKLQSMGGCVVTGNALGRFQHKIPQDAKWKPYEKLARQSQSIILCIHSFCTQRGNTFSCICAGVHLFGGTPSVQPLDPKFKSLPILLYSYESLREKKKATSCYRKTEDRGGQWGFMGFVGSYLIARCTPRLEALGMVPATVNLAILVEVDQIDQQFIADAADEARRVPADAVPSSRGKDGDVPSVDLPTALLEKPT